MAPSSVFHLTILSTFVLATILVSSSATETSGSDSWMPMKPACTGSIGDCMMDQEFDMDSESNRRILATTKYISYDALQKNSVPCSQKGASYYNCKQGAEANPYDRGCSAITRCRS
ncbi:Rapid alkalinization factor [Heracleum sosnowskyi]|uniref:Rapid alkalinization factor n=1 Tax=Heracleum sosnowskyi TaxID=360622 RepID=A0AAD8IHM6_9APIA|nr:Rapid alkalinization factor [Heracleum sosnowskyi]